MLVHQLKERIKEAFTAFAKTNHKIAFSRLLRTLILKIVLLPNHGGQKVDSGYERISNTLYICILLTIFGTLFYSTARKSGNISSHTEKLFSLLHSSEYETDSKTLK